MAKALGESARYVSQQAISRFRRMLAVMVATASGSSGIAGILLGSALFPNKTSPVASFTAMFVLVLAVVGIWKWSSRKLDTLEKQRMDMRRGAAGEAAVALTLADFPDDFYVVNDLTTAFGNLDHVVIGPTGVFIIDTKNWRGVVTPDGRGELLLNGQPTEKAMVKPFVARLMTIKEKVRVLAPGLDPYFQAVFVFTSARVNADWGMTGRVHCLRDDQLFSYIVEKDFGKKLTGQEIERIAQAFLSLAKMDVDFGSSPTIASLKTSGVPRLGSAPVQQAG